MIWTTNYSACNQMNTMDKGNELGYRFLVYGGIEDIRNNLKEYE